MGCPRSYKYLTVKDQIRQEEILQILHELGTTADVERRASLAETLNELANERAASDDT